ncbi:BTB/POZ domain-containing protein 6-like [Stylophora pistillata]|uniref:BTB/POZ domain-containing protein 6-like n=1 Tax=Stylophora pistillata TaxID=50429 RepID=UPI000C03DDFA|nr:BTB/POZ domain-containing protein 6-like [Stylophora pistillata]
MASNYEISAATGYNTSAAINNTAASAALVIGEFWQENCLTLLDRTKFIFNKELLSDVKFVVPAASSNVRRMIPAHKLILAISSPVFYAMFYGPMAETRSSFEFPDYEYESLLEFFRFLYHDEVNLSESNVLQVLHLAKQYMVPSLVNKCTKYLRDIVDISNVFVVLIPAQTYEEKDLEDKCWKVIEMQADQAVTSKEFFTVERSVVESVVKRETLNIKEVDLFKAVNQWATRKIETEEKTPDGALKRQVLGEEIVKAIRFALMSQREFASAVLDSGILTDKERESMMKYYSNVSTVPLPFLEVKRQQINFPRCHRFLEFRSPCSGSHGDWRYDGHVTDKLRFSVSKQIRLRGVRHFGSKGNEYTISLQVDEIQYFPTMCLVQESGNYASSEMNQTSKYAGFDVLFVSPVVLKADREYEIRSVIKGPSSWYGERGQSSTEYQGVVFTFKHPLESNSRTKASRGQFPSFIFT